MKYYIKIVKYQVYQKVWDNVGDVFQRFVNNTGYDIRNGNPVWDIVWINVRDPVYVMYSKYKLFQFNDLQQYKNNLF